MKTHVLCLITLATLLPSLALADSPQVYKWTDTAGVIHYSDKPPVQTAADVQTLDLPALPPQDPAAMAARQAALLSQIETLRQLVAQSDQQTKVAQLERKQTELETELAAAQQVQSQPEEEPLLYTSAFVPAVYRRNLYVDHPHRDHGNHPHQPPPSKLVMPLNPQP